MVSDGFELCHLRWCRKLVAGAVGGWRGASWEGRQSLTFLTFLFHSSFATFTLTVFCASPAETTMPLNSLEIPPEGVLVTVFAAAETAGATALADIAGREPPVVIGWCRGVSPGDTRLLFATASAGGDCSCEAVDLRGR